MLVKYGMAMAGILIALAIAGAMIYMWITEAEVPAELNAAFWTVLGWVGKVGFDAGRGTMKKGKEA